MAVYIQWGKAAIAAAMKSEITRVYEQAWAHSLLANEG